MSSREFFAVPKRLLRTRIFGKHDREDSQGKKLIEGADYFDEEIILNEAPMPKQTVIENSTGETQQLAKASPDLLTIVGVLPHHLISIQRFFQQKGLICKFDRETTTGELGNWTVVQLNKNIRDIPEIEFHTQFGPNIFGTCYIGRFRYENIEPIIDSQQQETQTIFREGHNENDRVSLPFDQKSNWVKFREFVIGQQEF